MKIKCDNVDNGCEWIGELCSLDKHLIICDYTFLSCPNDCEDGNKILRKDMERHKMKECPKREYVCPHCEESGEYVERTTTHLEECPFVKIPCSNDGCFECVARCKISSHYDECEFVMVPCKYAEIGCKVKVLRKDLKRHEEDRQQHLEFAIDAVPELHTTLKNLRCVELPNLEQQTVAEQKSLLELQEMVKRQENILAQLQSIVFAQNKEISELLKERQVCETVSSSGAHNVQSPVVKVDPVSLNVFRFTKYAERKSHNISVFSPPFYSSPGGYKLCIKVYANGNGKGKGTHISVFIYLMRGENDSHIRWPFTGIVGIELLNQLSNNFHKIMHIEFKDSEGKRVVDSVRAKDGHGHQRYVAHSSLDYHGLLNRQFLKDDCLYFRMKVNCTSNPKPWLFSANEF